MTRIAALYVETAGCYFGLPHVDPWDQARDARCYDGPHPVVAHPPCQRWGRFWHGSTRKPDQYGGRSCYVEQCHYGHPARKATYLYALGVDFEAVPFIWDRTRAEVPAWMIERYGEKKARKIGVVAMMGGKDKVKKRNATPSAFRDALLALAATARAPLRAAA